MNWDRLIAALAMLLVFGSAGAAQANDGDRLILGRENVAESPTVLDAGFGEPDITALTVNNPHGNGAIQASCLTNDCYVLWARTPGGIGLLAEGEVGVSGNARPDGIGVSAQGGLDGSDGMALYAAGPTVFTRSGVVTIPAGTASAKVTLTGVEGKLTSSSLVLAIPQMKPGADVFVKAAVPNVSTNSFIIYLNRPVARGARVGWFIVN